MAIVTFGNVSRVETAIEYTYNEDTEVGNGFTVTYEVPEESAKGSVPAMGSTTSRMDGVVLLEASIKPIEGGFASVTLKYGKKKADGGTTEDREEEEGGESGGDDTTTEEEEEVETWSIEGSVNDVPLLAHPKAQGDMDDAQREYLKAVMDGTRMWELVAELNEDGSPKLDKDKKQVMKPLKQLLKSQLSANGQEILKMILSGIRSYRSPGATFRETKIITSGSLTLSGLGKLSSPSNAPSVGDGRDWLLVGCNFYKDSKMKSNRWKAEYIHELSDEGGWNKKLYK